MLYRWRHHLPKKIIIFKLSNEKRTSFSMRMMFLM
jgi:hypothetical protein